MKTRIINSLDDLDAIGPAWTELEHNAVFPMQDFIWTRACALSFAHEDELHILVLEEAGKIIAIAPLVHYHETHHLDLLGVEELNEPTDVVYAHPHVLPALATEVARMGILLRFRRMPADSPFISALQHAYRGRGILIRRPDLNWPWLPLDARWEVPENQLNAGRRSDFRREQRIAEKFGNVTSEVITPGPAALPGLLDEAFQVEAAGWKGMAGTALAVDPLRAVFYHRYAEAACQKGILRLAFLRIDGRAVAMQLAIESRNQYWLLKIGYDQEFARCSPGNLLLRESLRYAALRGLGALVFLGTAEPWTRQWTEMEKPSVVLRGYPLGFQGMLKLAGDLASTARQKLDRFLERAA